MEGRLTQGSVSLDGTSAVRRTCNFSLVVDNFNVNEYLWSLKTKFKLYVGLENHIDDSQEPIIWFPQGIFILTSFSTSYSTNNCTISMSGKDKMCLLNGEVGGNLESEVDFGTIEQEDLEGNWTITKIPLKEIIFNAVRTYGKEPLHNIIIKDLDTYGLELLEYRGEEPIYLVRQSADDGANNLTTATYFNAYYDRPCKINGEETVLSKVPGEYLDSLLIDTNEPANIQFNGSNLNFKVAKVEYGDVAGYRITDLVYAGDLIAKAGEALTSILDKIRNMLVEFEYFYDIDGHFIFQKKPSYTSALWSFPSGEDKQIANVKIPEQIFEYQDLSLISSLSYNPNINNLKNDYVIWGERTTMSGAKVPVHLRYAVDIRPTQYTSVQVDDSELTAYNQKYNVQLSGQTSKTYTVANVDWREIIYQMAIDYYKYNHLDTFHRKVREANPELYPTGYTGYEQYYTDIQGFWRELYNPELNTNIEDLQKELAELRFSNTEEETKLKLLQDTIDQSEARQEEIQKGMAEAIKNGSATQNYIDTQKYKYYLETQTIIKARDEMALIRVSLMDTEDQIKNLEKQIGTLQEAYYQTGDEYQYWNKDIIVYPDTLNFWFDFFEGTETLMQNFGVKSVGHRPKVVNENTINSIYYRETPNVIYVDALPEEGDMIDGHKYIQIPNIEEVFSISAQGKSAKERLDELVFQHLYCAESINITSVPLYHLQPNSRIGLKDIESGLRGEYLVNKLTVPLAYNGTMSITATKIYN